MSEKEEGLFVLFICTVMFALGAVGGGCITTSDSRFLDVETVKAAPTECQLRRFGHAQKYVEACTPAFKSAVP